MDISQSVAELGLENQAIAAWPEPRVGQSFKPRFGSRPFPKKLLYAVLLTASFIAFVSLSKGSSLSIQETVLLAIGLIGFAWPVLILIDHIQKRNVWVYQDIILVTHGQDRIELRKSELAQVFVYRVPRRSTFAMEFLTKKGRSTVVALASEEGLPDLLERFRETGYPVKSEL